MSSPFDPPITAVREIVLRALAEDLEPLGDLTASLVPSSVTVRAEIRSRGTGVLAGTACAAEVCRQVDPAAVLTWNVVDGEVMTPGAVVGELRGSLASVLTMERSALNFLCHLSGVATLTAKYVAAVHAVNPRVQVWDTRKTIPGLRALEKAAVRAGGAVNHRGNLSDFILVKDNHLAGLTIAESVAAARKRWPGRTVEVECERVEQLHQAIDAGANLVMLDNMTPQQVAGCVGLVAGRALVEVSGGITLDNIGAYAAAGPDLISTSAITQSAPAFDLGLDLHDEHR